ncbi:MAG TPA: zf-HC2 domain-containing protein [Gemmatimonadaceae bacterium]
MSDCVNNEVREALPDLLNGKLSALDTATMNAHVESCADCRAELAILREAKSSVLLAPAIDVARISAAIQPYGQVVSGTLPARRPFLSSMNVLRVAAAAAIIAIGGVLFSSSGADSSRAVTQVATAPITEALPATSVTPGASQSAVTSGASVKAAQERQVAALSLVGTTSDLSDADLEQLVSELDQIETLPAAEPQSIITTIEDIASNEDSGF